MLLALHRLIAVAGVSADKSMLAARHASGRDID